MSNSVGNISLDLDVNQRGFKKQMNGLQGSITKTLGKLGSVAAGAFAIKKITDFAASCIDLGSTLTEVQNVVDTTFTTMSGKVNEFASNAIDTFGLSETVAKKYMGTLGAMSKAFGFSEGKAYEMSEALTGLAGDVASFYNISSDAAFTKLKSVFTGETESLKELGVVMTQSALDQYAMANGFGKTTAKMSEQEKVALRYSFVMDRLSLAQGDFARTSDQWANQTRVLSLRFDALKATIGQGLIVALTPVVKLLNMIVARLQVAADAFSNFMSAVFGGGGSAQKASVEAMGAISGATSEAVGGVETASKAAEKAAKKAQKSVMGFDGLNILQPKADASSDGASGGDVGGGGIGDVGIGAPPAINEAVESVDEKFKKVIDSMKTKALELVDIFKDGFEIGFKDSSLKPIEDSISSIKTSLSNIFTDPKVIKAADNYAKTVAKSLGRVTGSAASIGVSIGTFLFGSLSKSLSENEGLIKDSIVKLLDISSRSAEIFASFSEAVADIFTIFKGENAIQIGSDLISMFTEAFLRSTTLSAEFGMDVIEAILNPIIENKDRIKKSLEDTLGSLSVVVSRVKEEVSSIFDTMETVYEEKIKPAFDKIEGGISIVVKAILDAYDTYILPTINKIGEMFDEVYVNYIKPVIEKVIGLIGDLILSISEIWEETLAPFVAWFIDKFAKQISKFALWLAGKIVEGIEIAMKVLDDLLDALGGLIEFVTGVFTGDWEKAWSGIKKFFKGIIDAIIELVKPIGAFFSNEFKKAYKNVQDAFSGIKKWFQERYNDITGVFSTVATWFSTKFSEAWTSIKTAFSPFTDFFKDLWKGITKGFSDAIGSLSGLAKAPINAVIGMLNQLIGALNKVSFDIPDWDFIPKNLRGKKLGFSMSRIPALAQGGYVKANSPQLAMIGDNKRYGEIVAPENKLDAMAQKAAKLSGGGSNLEVIKLLKEIISLLKGNAGDTILYIDSTEIARASNKGNERLQYRYKRVKPT